ncbi:MAG: LacI family DNA-binding transcriptional regulator [Lentisphaerota bacterium]
MTALRKKQTHVSMQDVADYAKVSKGTVSKVLNSRSDVSEKAKAKVLAACEKLEYSLNPNIQDLLRKGVTGHSQDIAFVLVGTEFANPSYAGMIDGISQGAEKHNLHLILSTLSGGEESIYSLPPAIRDHRAAGILISGSLNEKIISLIRDTGIPYVVIGNYPNSITAFSNSVELNIGNLMHLAIRELKLKNKTRIAMFYEDPGNYFSQISFAEFKNALSANGMTFMPELIFEGKGGDFNAFDVMEATLSKKKITFDAIISLNFSASQEIACQIIANFGREKANHIIMTTVANFTKKMPMPTILCEEVSSKLAAMGLELLVEKLKNPDMEIKRVAFTPNLKLCL